MPDEHVFMDICASRLPLGRLIFKLNFDVCPITSENFRRLCTHEKGFGYANCQFFRIVPGFCACGGDFDTQNSTRNGGRSAMGAKYFNDENFTIRHTKRGILGMDNYGWPHTNNSRFYVTFGPTPWMDNFHVAFGEVVSGFDVLTRMESYGVLEGSGPQQGRTTADVRVVKCGLIEAPEATTTTTATERETSD